MLALSQENKQNCMKYLVLHSVEVSANNNFYFCTCAIEHKLSESCSWQSIKWLPL